MLLTFLFCVASSLLPSDNLVSDPGFEQSSSLTTSWVVAPPEHAGRYDYGRDSLHAHSGKYSLRVGRLWSYPRKPLKIATARPVPADGNKKYLLSFWYKSKDINEYDLPFTAGVSVKYGLAFEVEFRKNIPLSDEWKEYFILLDNLPHDATTLTVMFNLTTNSAGHIWLDDITLRVADTNDVAAFERWRRQTLPVITKKAGKDVFKATGFFRVEQSGSQWWLVDPAGKPFWALSIAGTKKPAQTRNTQSASGIPPYRHGEPEMQKMYSIFGEECGFNSLAGWSADEYATISGARFDAKQSYLPMTKVLSLASASRNPDVYAMDRNGKRLAGGHPFPDPFNPEWRQRARDRAERDTQVYRDKPWFLGWYVDNELDFAEAFRYIWAEYSSREFVKMLREKYQSIDQLNRQWSSSDRQYQYAAFEDILADKPEPLNPEDPKWPDFAAFERKMIGEYINYTYNLVKELDPNHLVISNRINLDPMPDLYRTIDLWGKYDIVCVNIYPDNNMMGFNSGEIEILKKVHQGTGRPVMIGEWSVPSIDSGLYGFGLDSLGRPLDWSWPQVLRTQEERAEAYNKCMKQLVSLNFMVGAGWFITYDADTRARRANRGIMNVNSELYIPLVRGMKATHDQIKKELGLIR